MSAEDFKEAWQSETSESRVMIDAEVLLAEVQRKQRQFDAVIFWRDFREVGVCLLMIPVWLYLGIRLPILWTWFLMIPVLLWIAGFMLVDRRRQVRRRPKPGEPLRQVVASSLAEVEHQIRLLRNVHWWYLLPIALPILAFVGQGAWQERAGGWFTALVFLITAGAVAGTFAAIYWANQYAVRTGLEPRRRELEVLLTTLNDETPDAG
jgi:hypothetical protein